MGRHFYMRHGTFTLTLPSNAEHSVPQIKMLLKEIEIGIRKKMSLRKGQDNLDNLTMSLRLPPKRPHDSMDWVTL